MQSIYNYIPETNHVSRVYSVAAVLYLQSVLHVMLLRPWNMFCSFTLELSAVCMQRPTGLFLQFLNFVLSSFVAQVLSEQFWNGSSRPIITGINFAFTFHMHCISIMRSLYILKSSQLLPSSHFCLLELQQLLTCTFLVYYYGFIITIIITSWWGNGRERDHWGDLGVDGWIILRRISRRWDVGIWTGLDCPRIETGGGRMWVR